MMHICYNCETMVETTEKTRMFFDRWTTVLACNQCDETVAVTGDELQDIPLTLKTTKEDIEI